MRWYTTSYIFWSTLVDFADGSVHCIREVKGWYQCRCCRGNESVAVACPFCYRPFDGSTLDQLHARQCTNTYAKSICQNGDPVSIRDRWYSLYKIHLLTARTQELFRMGPRSFMDPLCFYLYVRWLADRTSMWGLLWW